MAEVAGARMLLLRGGLLALVVAPSAVPFELHADQGYGTAGWPAFGFAVALLLVVPRKHRPLTAAVITLAVTPALAFSYSVSWPLAGLGALALSLPALFVASTLLRGHQARFDAPVHLDSPRVIVVVFLGAVLNSVLPTVITLRAEGPFAAFATFVVVLLAVQTAQLVVLPLFLLTSDRRASGSAAELGLQRLVLLGVMTLTFWVFDASTLTVLVLPVICWAAVRATQWEVHVQTFVVSVLAYGTTALGDGPFAEASLGGLPDEFEPVLIYLFLLALCYTSVPLAMAVDRLSSVTGAALRASSTVEQMLDSSTGTLFIATDREGLITRFSNGAQQTLGYRPEEVLGRSPRMFVSDQELARQSAAAGLPADYALVTAAHLGRQSPQEWRLLRRDGRESVVSLSISELTAPSGRVIGHIVAGEDVTERLRVELVMRTALEREHASVMRLQEVDRVKQELVSNVSHELRTPITSIIGYTELLADDSLGELGRPQRDALRRIERNALRLQGLVDDLLTLSRAESGRLQLTRTSVDLRQVVATAWDLFDEQLRRRDLETRLQLPPEPLHVLGDRGALERVVVNLVSNAVKFTPDGGSVSITLTRTEHATMLLVRDSGIGISDADQAQLFTRFFRSSHATDAAIQGTGLGLSIVQALVSQHGGQVLVRSRVGQGTRVTVELPVT